jgi:hypothetical protein
MLVANFCQTLIAACVAVSKTTGDQVQIELHGGDFESGRIVGFIHSEQDVPPVVQSGEILVQHQNGNKVFVGQGGNVLVHHNTGAELTTQEAKAGSIWEPQGVVPTRS